MAEIVTYADEIPEGAQVPEVVEGRLTWPAKSPRELSTDVPEKIRGLFVESSRAEDVGAYRLAGAGYRATVEEICKDQGAQGNNLFAKIKDLGTRGVIAQDLADAFDEARYLGNDSLHDGLAYAPDEVADVAELIQEATEVLYVQPADRARMRQARSTRRAAHKAAQQGP
ncbi:DUF4145 domain-containing protein [Embleya hyalina]|nr:DUF4145 domain-containing protein [Embleya hyalina]